MKPKTNLFQVLRSEKQSLNFLKNKSFLSTEAWTFTQMQHFISAALDQKKSNSYGRPLLGKQVGLVFFNPSLRTRVSMANAVTQLGGTPVMLDVGRGVWDLEHRDGMVMDGGKPEHVRDAVPLLGEYFDLLAVRCFPGLADYEEDQKEPILSAFNLLSAAPVINLESSLHHPCQALADMMTIREAFSSRKPKKIVMQWSYHPKPLPLAVGNSFALAAVQNGYDLTVVNPPGFDLMPDFMSTLQHAASESGGSVSSSHNRDEALQDAEVVYAKSWMSPQHYGQAEADLKLRAEHRDWIVDDAAMSKTSNAYFMHCLPVRRNVEVSDSVIDGARSLTQKQGLNRLHAQKSLMTGIFS